MKRQLLITGALAALLAGPVPAQTGSHVAIPASAAGAGASEAAAAKAVWLGVTTEAASDEVRSQLSLDPGVGLTVFGVTPDSPAAAAGLQNHDILVRFGDQKLMDPDQLRNLVRAKKAGDPVELTYVRKGREAKASAILAEHEVVDSDGGQVIDLGNFNLDVSKLIGRLPQFDKMTSLVGSNFVGSSSSGADIATAMKNLKISDTNIARLMEEALKSIGQAPSGSK